MYRGYTSKPGPKDKAMRELKEENESLKGALQAALLYLEPASDALVPPSIMPAAAAALIDAALVVIREELDV